jgi:hypothetical protein
LSERPSPWSFLIFSQLLYPKRHTPTRSIESSLGTSIDCVRHSKRVMKWIYNSIIQVIKKTKTNRNKNSLVLQKRRNWFHGLTRALIRNWVGSGYAEICQSNIWNYEWVCCCFWYSYWWLTVNKSLIWWIPFWRDWQGHQFAE